MASYRKERVSELLLSFLANEIRQLSGPLCGVITLTSVDVSRDLKVAKIYWSLLLPSNEAAPSGLDESVEVPSGLSFPSDVEIKNTLLALKDITKFLRKRIADELTLRFVPDLVFKYDESLAKAHRIDCLLKKANN